MSITLSDYANGNTDYISKLNADNTTLETAINALQASVAGLSNAANLPSVVRALVGAATARISSTSLVAAIVGQTVTFTAGYAWVQSSGVMVASGGGTVDLTGLANGTYYLKISAAGVLTQGTSTDALYSVVKTGTSLGTLTEIAPVSPGADDNIAALSSSVRGPFATLDARIEAIETGGAGGSGTQPYDLPVFFPGSPVGGGLMFRMRFTRNVTLPISLTGSIADARVAATAATTLTMKKTLSGGGTSTIGTINWALGATAATFTFAAGVTFAAGDLFTIENQVSADATLADISMTIAGTR